MSWYVVEGPDQTGKTTLAKGLERRGWAYQHCDENDTLPKLAQRMQDFQDWDNMVWDRAHLGEFVHHNQRIAWGWWHLLEAFLLERDTHAFLFTLRYPPSDKWENDPFTHSRLVHEFQAAAANSTLLWNNRWPDPMPRSRNFGVGVEERAENWIWSQDRADPEGLGGLANMEHEPQVWVLGEQQNPDAQVHWPFATRCGIELVWPAIRARDVRVSNALPSAWRQKVANPYSDLHERWEVLGKPPVVTLGKLTQEACKQADVAVHSNLPHPQWHLRFKAKEPETYRYHLGMAILNAMRSEQ